MNFQFVRTHFSNRIRRIEIGQLSGIIYRVFVSNRYLYDVIDIGSNPDLKYNMTYYLIIINDYRNIINKYYQRFQQRSMHIKTLCIIRTRNKFRY